jgi:hypothetical protein
VPAMLGRRAGVLGALVLAEGAGQYQDQEPSTLRPGLAS